MTTDTESPCKRATLLKGVIAVALALLLVIPMTSCEEDDPMIPGEEENDDNDNVDTTGNQTNFDLINQFPSLPTDHYNYADIDLPPPFNAGPIQDQDNTPANNPVTDAGATLGRVLFYDKHLSVNNTIACASCHQQDKGFSDPAAFSTGFEGGLTGRNSMGLTNARFYENGHFFWDERAASLEDQVLMPIQDATEMGMGLGDLVNKLKLVEYYEALFIGAFGTSEITADRISLALSQFVRAMVSYESKFDQGMALVGPVPNLGAVDFPNFTASENLGKELFFSARTNCATCHRTINFVGLEPRNNGLNLVYTDNGVGELTNDPQDFGDFKVNSLRNIEFTVPYMHDGRFADLEAVVEHYNAGVQPHANLSPQLITGGPGGPPGPPGPRRLNLTTAEKVGIIDFLETLSDVDFLSDVRFSDPFE